MRFTRRSTGMGSSRRSPRSTSKRCRAASRGSRTTSARARRELLDEPGRADGRAASLGSSARNEVEVTGVDGVERVGVRRRILISTGSRPRIPDWCTPDGDRILDDPRLLPAARCSRARSRSSAPGVTGVEFVHMFSSFGAEVTLVVSRQQVLPSKDPEVAAVLEDDFLQPGRQAAEGGAGDGDRPRRRRRRGRALRRRAGRAHRPRRAGDRLGAEQRRARPRSCRRVDRRRRLRHDQPPLPEQRRAHLRRGRRQRQAAAVVGRLDAGPQGRRARDGPAQASRTATSTTTRRPRRSSPSRRSPTSGWPRPRRSPSGARSGSPRCRSAPRPRR